MTVLIVTDFYELYLENCHCRHLFLALGRQSEYYKVLSTYADDDYTMRKTSLVKLAQEMPQEHSLPFHMVSFSSLENVRRQTVSFDDGIHISNGFTTQDGRLANPAVSNPVAPAAQALNPSAPKFIIPSTSAPRAFPGVKDISKPARTMPESPRFEPMSMRPASNGNASNGNALTTSISASMSMPTPGREAAPVAQAAPPEDIPALKVQGTGNGTSVEDSSSAGVVKLDTSSHSSHHSNNAEQNWETATTTNYTPAPIAGEWGEDPLPQVTPQKFEEQPSYSRNQNANFNRRQPKTGNGTGGGGGKPSGKPSGKRMPKQFEGSWDDMVGSQGSSSPPPKPATASMSSSATMKSTDHATFAVRQVVTKSEPNPHQRPVCAPIALNRSGQRIDLKLPRPTAAEEEAFKTRTNNRHLCNEQHLRGKCADVKCTYDHEEISDGLYLALRNTARYSPCSQGPECRRYDCYLAHHCPSILKASPCARPKCPFKARGLHDVVDLEIVEMIEPSKPAGEMLIEGLI